MSYVASPNRTSGSVCPLILLLLACSLPAAWTGLQAQSFAGYPAVAQLSGTVTVLVGGSSVTGSGTSFLGELNVGDAIRIGSQWLTVDTISSNTSLTLRGTHSTGALGVTAFTSGWPETFCNAAGPFTDCWVSIPRFGFGVSDFNETGGGSDTSKKTTPSPPENDLFQGQVGDLKTGAPDGQVTTMYAYDPIQEVVFLRMRLDEEPTSAVNGSSDPGTESKGPYKDNTAWNFIFDFNGDGWGDIVATTDGNSGATAGNTNTDDIQLAWVDNPGLQSFTNTAPFCIDPGGEILFRRKANVSPFSLAIPGCDAENDPICDFVFTRVTNECADTSPAANCTTDGTNFFLDMQFPRGAFDDCETPGDPDSDGVGGDQVLETDTRFMVCVTTSTQPNNYTNKDLALASAYLMDEDKPLPCSDPCTLTTGCSQIPFLFDISAACGSGTNNSPINLTAQVMDTVGLTGTPSVVADSIAQVQFSYVQEDGAGGVIGTWTPAVPIAGSSNPVTSPGAQINLWSMNWDTSGLSLSPSSIYQITAEITDEQGNTYGGVYSVDLSNCDTSISTPVTLASFQASPRSGGIDISWETATEAGNAGFNLYARTPLGWQRLNHELIPSPVVDSTQPQSYEFRVEAVPATAFAIEDVDVHGKPNLKGPFSLGQQYGEPLQAREVDWASVRTAMQSGSGSRGQGRDASGPRDDVKGLQYARMSFGKPPELDLLVDRDGIYRLSFQALSDAGFDFSRVAANSIALLKNGEPLPIRVVGGSRFGPGSYLEFWGEAARSLYTDTAVYRLKVSSTEALRITDSGDPISGQGQPAPFYMHTLHFENQREYSFAAPGNDPWFDTRMISAGGPAVYNFEFSIDGFQGDIASSILTTRVWGVTNWPLAPDHHLLVELNGVPLASRFFDGREVATIQAELPAGVLREGSNQLTLRLPGDTAASFDLISLDSYSITYPREFRADSEGLRFSAAGDRFRVTGLNSANVLVYRFEDGAPQLLTGASVDSEGSSWSVLFPGNNTASEFLVIPEDAIRVPGMRAARDSSGIGKGTAEFLIISHPLFLPGLGPLVAARQAEGLSVRVIDVEEVYAQFSHGVFDPAAIRQYIAHAATHMKTRYVLLVGSDTYDYKDYLGLGSVSFIPSLYVSTGPIVRFAPSDPLFGDINGDLIPEVSVGRFPIHSLSDLSQIVEKTLAYDSKTYARSALLTADLRDTFGDISFTAQAENLARRLEGWDLTRAYLDQMTVSEARDLVLSTLNRGVALTSFAGHSSPTLWTSSNLFSSTDARALQNTGSPTAVLQWGCWNTYHVEPRYQTLGSALIVQDSGAAIVLGSSTLTESESARALGARVEPLLIEPGMRIGDALTQARQELSKTSPDLLDVILGWSILGDPTLIITP